LANAYTTAPGSDANDGLSPGSPKLSLQAVLDDAAHPVQTGDVVLVDAGNYPTPTFLGTTGNGLLIIGSPSEPAAMAGTISATNTTNLTLDHLNISGGFWSSGGSNLTVVDNTVQGAGLTVTGGTTAQIVGNLVIPSGAGITLQGAAVNPLVEHNRIAGGSIGIIVNGSGATGVEVRDNRIIGAGQGITIYGIGTGHIGQNRIQSTGTGINLAMTFTGQIEGNDVSGAGIGVYYSVCPNTSMATASTITRRES